MATKKYENHEAYMEAKKIRDVAYDAENTTRVAIKLNNKTDADILAHLAQQRNKQGYIKELIRADMERKNNG